MIFKMTKGSLEIKPVKPNNTTIQSAKLLKHYSNDKSN